jgi:AcrR family transcriptional regulator
MNMCSWSKTDLTRQNLLDAVERLCVTGPMSRLTMRAIAEEAGCSLGLAYRYFETKEQLLGAVLDRAAEYITSDLEPDEPPEHLAQKVWRRMAERPVFARLLVWFVLEELDVTRAMSGHPFLQTAYRQAELAGDANPPAAAAALGITMLGGGLFIPVMTNALGGRLDEEAVYERLLAAAAVIRPAPNRGD